MGGRTAAVPAVDPETAAQRRRLLFDHSLLLANVIEHCDSAFYGFLVPVLAPLFFPHHDVVVAMIWGYGVLASTLLTRPLGAYCFGLWARRFGPFRPLSCSIIGSSVATCALAMVPTHGSVGAWGGVLLIACRFIRGFFAAGEGTLSKLLLITGKKGVDAFRASYTYPAASMGGMIIASALGAVILKDSSGFLHPHGWRWCFAAFGLLGLGVYGLRRLFLKVDLPVADAFQGFETHHLRDLVRHWPTVLTVAMTTGVSHITSLLPFVILVGTVPLLGGITLPQMMAVNTGLLVIDFLLIPLVGRYLSGYAAPRILMVSAAILAISLPILLTGIQGDTPLWGVTAIRLWIIFWGVVFLCPQHVYYHDLTEKMGPSRYFLVGMGNALGGAVIGRLSPVIMMALFHLTGTVGGAGYYGAVIAVCGGVSVWWTARSVVSTKAA